MENLEIYEQVRNVPEEAKKRIGGGRLKGITDINPMWRIKKLTEVFGPIGFGWYYEIADKWVETAMAKDEITANVKINLFVKRGEEWSKPIQGIGGSMLVAAEKSGLYVNDECYKMALTDAISVACKGLGMGADVYWGNDNTKYNDGKISNVATQKSYDKVKESPKKTSEELADMKPEDRITAGGADYLLNLALEVSANLDELFKYYEVDNFEKLTLKQFEHCKNILEKRKKEQGK